MSPRECRSLRRNTTDLPEKHEVSQRWLELPHWRQIFGTSLLTRDPSLVTTEA
ncbi:hypothetical protein BDW72DRAFT_188290 [Aspergillus terricola var. indicus]